MKRMKFD